MGGSQSSRKLSVDNENSIQVSQEALDRIKAQLSSNQDQSAYIPASNYESHKRTDNAAEEAYWARRIENLKRSHEKISTSMLLEYQKTLKEANDLFQSSEKDKSTNKLPPCQDEKTKVLQCYSDNPNKSLLCSMLVNEFKDCVCKSRVAAVSS